MNEGMSGLRVTHNISLLVHQYSSVEFLRHGLILSSSLQKTPDVCFWSFISSFETPGHGIISKFTSEHIWTVSIVNSPVACLGFPHFSSSLRVNNSNVFLFISFILEKPHGLCGIDENHFSPKLRWTLLGILLPPSATVTGPGNMAFSGMDELVQMWSILPRPSSHPSKTRTRSGIRHHRKYPRAEPKKFYPRCTKNEIRMNKTPKL